ncbi:histidine phosphatase family protein [Heyndrickxia vini]|uniref:Histidine phosphatase family protein n=1 Tax=Heyndrickxia vini TaxID=1476025 RepID=A0ABX7DZR8_9BACI|nr:histidine phosphatase family protein [Heyndrickxia vini]QQZ08978.1 histidine phosphatase family protein [Heyndrickxia vini]
MKIGLIRHYKVLKDYPKEKRLYSAEEVKQWFAEYDVAEIEYRNDPPKTTEWKACYSSPTSRAIKTAKHLYDRDIIELEELQEIAVPVFSTRLKLPFIAWALLIRFANLFNKQTREEINQTKKKINYVLDEISKSNKEDILIISHAALMFYIRKELLKRGFTGPKFTIAKNGELYEFIL